MVCESGSYSGHAQTMRTCKNILDFAGSLWHFFEVAGVPPTNNHAEQQLRPLVISKKLTFGTQSERGSRFIERIFTVTTTCKQQDRDTLAFIIDSVQKFFMGLNGTSFDAISVKAVNEYEADTKSTLTVTITSPSHAKHHSNQHQKG